MSWAERQRGKNGFCDTPMEYLQLSRNVHSRLQTADIRFTGHGLAERECAWGLGTAPMRLYNFWLFENQSLAQEVLQKHEILGPAIAWLMFFS